MGELNTVAPQTKTRGDLRIPPLLGSVVLLSRLPFIGHGYGEDPDAWRAMIAAQHLLDTGEYVPSRGAGYPLPEYFNTFMLWAGLGSSWWIGLVTAILSGVAAALIYQLFSPLGPIRAAAGAVAFAFTPEVFVSSISAMDFMWGVAFFLAATLCVSKHRIWWCALFLGLAVASRLTYVVAVIPLVLLYVEFNLGRLRRLSTWREIVPPGVLAAAIAAVFYLPAFLTKGVQMFRMADSGTLLRIPYEASVGMFGVIGSIAVAAAVVSVLVGRPRLAGFDWWAITVITLWAVLFIRLPHDASYLFPALIGLYWLLCRYAKVVMLWLMSASLVVSCFVLRFDGSEREFSPAGPVIWSLQAQAERDCIAQAVASRIGESDNNYVVAGYLRPQLRIRIGAPLSERILHFVRPEDGRLRDNDGVQFPADANLWVVDWSLKDQRAFWKGTDLPILHTDC